jgi:hypothetical protein
MDLELKERAAVISGGSRSIGKAAACGLAAERQPSASLIVERVQAILRAGASRAMAEPQ